LVVHIEGGTEGEGFRGSGPEEDILVYMEQVRGDWRRLHNEELHEVYFSPYIPEE
jgi:hypothetical protein